MKIIKYTLLFISIILIAIVAFGPNIAINQLEKNSKEWVGRKISIGDYSLNVFTGTMSITDFTLYETNDSSTFVSFDKFLIDLELYRLFSNKFVVEEVKLIGLQTYITQNDTIFNFDDLIAFYGDSTVVEEVPTDTINEKKPMAIEVSNIQLNAKTLSYTEMVLEHETELVNLNINLPYISWNTEGGSRAGIEFDLNNNGHFGFDMDFNPDSNEFIVDINIDNLNLATYYVYAREELNISKLEGILNSHIIINGDIDEIDKLIIEGELGLSNFVINDTNQQKLMGVEQLNIGISKIDEYNEDFIFDSIHFYNPYLNFELFDKETNLEKVLKETSEEAEVNTSDTTEDTMYYAINSFIIKNAVVDFKDHTTPRTFTYYLSEINMTANDITSDTNWVKTHLDILLNKRGKMNVEFGFNPMKPEDLTVDYVMTNFKLSDINIYSELNTGYPFVNGDMYYYSKTTVRNGIIKSENKLRINDVEVGEKVEGWKSIPLKFALYILKDKHGDIVLDIPIRGDVNDPDINIKKLAWTSFKNAIFKIASSPVDFISGLGNVDPNDVKTIEFEYGDTTLTNKITKQLDMLIEIEEAKPELSIALAYYNDTEKEKSIIAIKEIGTQFNELQQLDYLNNKVEFETYIKSRTLSDSVNIETDCLQLLGNHKTDSIFQTYTKLRFEKINNYLKSQKDSTLIFIEPFHSNSPKNTASIPMFDIKYSID